MTRAVTVLALAVSLLADVASAAGQSPSPQVAGRRNTTAAAGAIRGRVTIAGSETPLRGAEIRAIAAGIERGVIADDEGRFEVGELPAGKWKVTASRPGFVTWQFGQRRPFETPPPIVLADGERVTANLTVPRASAISGRVSDEFGEPLSAIRVNVFRSRMVQGQRRLHAVGAGDQTDDTGTFRVYGLAPGDYYIAASLRVAPVESVIDTTYAPTYFPGTGNLAEAQRVSLGLAAEARADFQLLPVHRVRVSGVVFNSAGAPADAFLNLVSEGTELGVPLGIGGVTQPDGRFTLPDVAPGRYILNASLRENGPGEAAAMPITIGSDDATGITLVTGKGGTVRGTFALDAGTSRPLPRGLGVNARSTRTGMTITPSTVSGNRFELSGLTGPFHLEIGGVPEGWAVKSVNVDNVDVTDSAIELVAAQEATARVVLTDRVTDLRGTIASPDEVRDHTVVVFPEDSSKWSPPSRFVRTVRADALGAFRIVGLPPGERYLALAVDYLEEGESDEPEFLASMAARATRFSIAEDDERTVDLTLVQR